jgi:putative membrane protein
MSKTVAMMGVLTLAASAALAQSTTTTSGQASGTSGQSTSGQSTSGQDMDRSQGTSGQGTSGQSTSGSGMDTSRSSSMSSAAGDLDASDRRFIEKAARSSMAEVELGKLAAEKGSSPEVKAFGQMIVDAHTKAADELKSLAAQKGVTLPSDADSDQQSKVTKLQNMSGDEFDRAFMKEMVKEHKKDISDFKKAAKDSKDPELKQWAAGKVPTLEQHLQHAEMAANMGTAAGATSATGTGSDTSTSGTTSGTSSSDPNKDKSKQKDKDKDAGQDPPPPSR